MVPTKTFHITSEERKRLQKIIDDKEKKIIEARNNEKLQKGDKMTNTGEKEICDRENR